MFRLEPVADGVVDRVAAAIYSAAMQQRIVPSSEDGEPPAWASMNRHAKKYWRKLATAAVAVLLDTSNA